MRLANSCCSICEATLPLLRSPRRDEQQLTRAWCRVSPASGGVTPPNIPCTGPWRLAAPVGGARRRRARAAAEYKTKWGRWVAPFAPRHHQHRHQHEASTDYWWVIFSPQWQQAEKIAFPGINWHANARNYYHIISLPSKKYKSVVQTVCSRRIFSY